jgi:hypothetical protein
VAERDRRWSFKLLAASGSRALSVILAASKALSAIGRKQQIASNIRFEEAPEVAAVSLS